MSTQPQKGFAHAFLIIGLVVALIGALGFVFWQNFIYKEPVQERIATTESNPPIDKYSKWTTYEDKELGFGFKYPSDWKLEKTSTGLALTSPDKKDNTSNGLNAPRQDVALVIESKTGSGSSSSSGSILALKADQNGQDTTQYFSKKYTETINSLVFTEFEMKADPSYFTAVFAVKDSYVAVDFLTVSTKSELTDTLSDILASFK